MNSLNILSEEVIQLKNKFYKLVIEILYNKTNIKIKAYFQYRSYCDKQIQINRYYYNNDSII